MGAYKQFNSQDVIISPFEVNKGFTFQGETEFSSSNVQINRYTGKVGSFIISQSLTGNFNEEYEVLVYNSVRHLYYTNYISGSSGQTADASTASYHGDGRIYGDTRQTSFYNFDSTNLNPHKHFPSSSNDIIGIISIPSKLFGDYIQPNSFEIISPISGSITDDGEGRLINGTTYVGNIIYQHGIIILCCDTINATVENQVYGTISYGTGSYGDDVIIADNFISTYIEETDVTCSFSSSFKIYETQYKCNIGQDEFNYTLNPTITTGSGGEAYDYATSSYFEPYITSIGLYNEKHELLAVGKFAKPLPKNNYVDTNILINIDR